MAAGTDSLSGWVLQDLDLRERGELLAGLDPRGALFLGCRFAPGDERRLRDRGAIIYAKSNAHEFNGGPGDPGGPAQSRTNAVAGGQAISAWAGQACNPYDTERVPRGSSSGSGVAVAANLVTIGVCEQTGASCQGPASRNGIATLLTTKGVLPDGGGIGNQWFIDRAGIHARTLADAAKVLDAINATGYGLTLGVHSRIDETIERRWGVIPNPVD